MLRPQEIILQEGKMRTIGNRRVSPAPPKGQLKSRVLCNHIAHGCLQLGGRHVLRSEPSQDLQANRSRAMAGCLGGPQFTGRAKNGEAIA